MASEPRESKGEFSNRRYCDRLIQLAFPAALLDAPPTQTVEIDHRLYSRSELREVLEQNVGLALRLRRRYHHDGRGRDWSLDELVDVAFLPKIGIGPDEYTEAALQRELPSNPKLQQRAAVRLHYVPSKWLLEQEMEACGRWSAENGEDVYLAAARAGLTGVCFSGGGIRSATFNLGVLQGLAQVGMLPHVDYLSSVSGGGYIHEFLAAWILRHSQGSKGVIDELIPQAEPGCLPRAPEPIKWLMRYASYLTPERGPLSADTWTLIAIWLRNTILNQVPILAGLAFAFLVVHLLAETPVGGANHFWSRQGTSAVASWICQGIIGMVLTGIAIWSLVRLGRNLEHQRTMHKPGPASACMSSQPLLSNTDVQLYLIVPWLGLSVWLSYWVQWQLSEHCPLFWIGLVPFCLWVLAAVMVVIFAGGAMDAYGGLHPTPSKKDGYARSGFIGVGVLSAFFACGLGWGFVLLSARIAKWIACDWVIAGDLMVDPWRIQLALLPGLLLSVPYVAIEMAIGLLGRDYSDMRREWLARLRAWSLLYALLWGSIVSVALLGPYVVYWLVGIGPGATWSAVVTFLAAHGATIFSGWSGKADGKPTDNGILGFKPMDLLAMAAAPVTIVGLLIGVSFGASYGLDHMPYASGPGGHYWLADLLCCLGIGLIAALFGWRVDINEFSMQSFYRNRLTRCYLAATITERQADPFTGFDGRSEITLANGKTQTRVPRVSDLLPDQYSSIDGKVGAYQGPFPIFCTTLNLTTGEDLATQERKGTSFAFTPLYSGYSVSWTDGDEKSSVSYNGYVPTQDYAYSGKGISLDTAVAISGAAVNPNMGYNSNPALAFLMTFFNVRLGWWISNTRKKNQWPAGNTRPTPQFAAWYLFRELFGKVNDAAPYVNLSDGGHFDNMGLYELVRRRCRYIIVCDAEEDREMKFEGIGAAITKCRADFGADIDLDLRPLQIQEETGYSKVHCVVGTIQYPPPPGAKSEAEKRTSCQCLDDTDDDPYTGYIVYMKSSLVGDEPPDLLTYQLKHKVFPQDSTADQWFQETQFEAYRRLGHHISMATIPPALQPTETQINSRAEIPELFRQMNSIWYPRTPEMDKYLDDHLKQLEAILKELRDRPELAGLETALTDAGYDANVQWAEKIAHEASLPFAMQFANSLLKFMYTVYTNLQLAFPDNRTSPHAVWWICFFRRWCRVDLIQKSWAAHLAVYPAEFVLFARRELGL